MIVTILPSSTSFHAIGYNEHKVKTGKAQVLEMKNTGHIGKMGTYQPEELIEYFNAYTSRNDRIKKPQFHIAISCKGREKSFEELVDFAHAYLKEMGYGEEGQPVMIYAHTDTDNNHIHVVTSRIGPDGKKINHSKERIRSQQVIAKLLNQDLKEEAQNTLEKAECYAFNSKGQFKALLSTMGYETYEKEDCLIIKKGGISQTSIPLAELQTLFRTEEDKKRQRQLKAIVKKYRDIASDIEDLTKTLKKRFGIDLVFFGPKDNPQGYFLIDHSEKKVYNGSQMMRTRALLDNICSPIERFDKIDEYIGDLLDENPKTSTYDLFEKLRKHKAFVRKGVIYLMGQKDKRPIRPDLAEKIMTNDKISRVESFNPASMEEATLLCTIYKIPESAGVIEIKPAKPEGNKSFEDIITLFNQKSGSDLRGELRALGYIIKHHEGRQFAINFATKSVIDLSRLPIDITRLYRNSQSVQSLHSDNAKYHNTSKKKTDGISDHNPGKGENREWEISSAHDDRIDDRMQDSSLKY